MCVCVHAYMQILTQAGAHSHIQADRQTDRQTDTHTHRYARTHTHTEIRAHTHTHTHRYARTHTPMRYTYISSGARKGDAAISRGVVQFTVELTQDEGGLVAAIRQLCQLSVLAFVFHSHPKQSCPVVYQAKSADAQTNKSNSTPAHK